MDSVRNILLIVDDEPDVLETLSQTAESFGIKTLKASNVVEALNLLDSQSEVAAVLSDLSMPEEGGLDLLKRLRGDGNDIPFILISAHGSKENLVAAIQYGATFFEDKPFDDTHLKDTLFRAMEMGRRQKRIVNQTPDEASKELIRDRKMISLIRVRKS